MKKAESLSAITKLWKELPKEDQAILKFHDFYCTLEQDHPELLKWRNLSGQRDKEVKAHLDDKGLIDHPI